MEETNYTLAFNAYAVKPGICLEGWESLRNTGYRIEYRLGSKRPGNILPRMVDSDHLSRVPTIEQGLKKLLLGRTDVYIDVESIVLVTIRDLKRSEPQAAAIYKAGVMERFTAHAFLHKKNAALVPRLNDILKAMKKEGLIELYRIRAEQESSP